MESENKKITFDYKNLGIILSFVIILSVIMFLFLLFMGGRKKDEPIVEPQMNQTNEEQLKVEDIKEGTGKEAVNGSKISVNYLGTLVDGTKFDSSYDRKEPFSFILGEGSVIPGWDLGLLGMKEGGKRKLTIPPGMGYGESGSGPIPPSSTLIFEVELISVE